MTSKELIKLLQEADPTGELDVFVHGDGNSPYSVGNYPFYYDGRECIVVPFKARMAKHEGNKLIIRTTDLETYMADTDNNVDGIEMPCGGCDYCKEKIESARFYPDHIPEGAV